MASRRATHAGAWYLGSKHRLEMQMDQFLDNVPPAITSTYDSLPVPGARFLVGPHAGYSFAGQTLAHTYKAWDISNCKRVFILGPSHHVYFKGAQLTPFSTYETPLGNVPVDTDMVETLMQTGKFKKMSMTVDEDEHSFEMHMPFIYKMTAGSDEGVRPIVPILIGHSPSGFEESLAQTLAPYFADPENAFIISTDFCHWGDRFDYMAYTTDQSASDLHRLRRNSTTDPTVPIYKSIEILDRLGMQAASTSSVAFDEYLDRTENTICGRHPLAIVLKTMEATAKQNSAAYGKLQWMSYAQSSQITKANDSSVSYASGFAVA